MSAPRKHLTPADIDAAIAGEAFQRMEGTQITLCVLTMRNGARVAGINYGSIDPARQDWEQGARLAREVPLVVDMIEPNHGRLTPWVFWFLVAMAFAAVLWKSLG